MDALLFVTLLVNIIEFADSENTYPSKLPVSGFDFVTNEKIEEVQSSSIPALVQQIPSISPANPQH